MAGGIGNVHRRIDWVRGFGVIVEAATRTHARALMVLAAAALLNLLPGFFSIPPIDRDEARFAQATKHMVETGDLSAVFFQSEARPKASMGAHWLQAGIVKAASAAGVSQATTTIWLYRLPSLAGALGGVFLTYWAALAFVTRRAALFAGLMIASCVLLGIAGRLATADALLLPAAIAAMGAFARIYLPERRTALDRTWGWVLPGIFWTALAAGVLLKGFVLPLFAALAVATLVGIDRSAPWLAALRPLPGMAWFAVLLLPWFLTIVLRSGDGAGGESIARNLIAMFGRGPDGRIMPPGYFFALFWIGFWPGATLAGLAASAVYAARREPGAKFLLAWLVPSWAVLEIMLSKRPPDVLPLYPAIAILIAGIMDARMFSRAPWTAQSTVWWFLLPAIVGTGAIVALIVVGRQFGLLAWLAIGAALILGLFAWRLYESDGAERALMRAVGAALLTSIAVFGLVIPSLPQLFPSVALARVLRQSGCATPVAAAAGYQEPSLVFLAGTATQMTDGAGAAEFLRGGECRFAFIEMRHERNFAQRADAIGLNYSQGPRIEAVNTNNGRWITIAVYRSEGPR